MKCKYCDEPLQLLDPPRWDGGPEWIATKDGGAAYGFWRCKKYPRPSHVPDVQHHEPLDYLKELVQWNQ